MSTRQKTPLLATSLKDEIDAKKFYAEQRDKHLQQIMTINGQGTFSTLAIVGAIFLGALNFKGSNFKMDIIDKVFPWFITFWVGIAMILAASALYSVYNFRRMRRFEELIQQPEAFDTLENNAFRIIPKSYTSALLFFGLLALLVSVFGILFIVMKYIN